VVPARVAETGPASAGTSAATAAIRLRSVTRVFGATPALVRADLEVAPGEVVLIRGPNGAGKTTLLRVISTALSPTYGGGAVLGLDLLADREAIRRRTELLGHRTRLYDDLTVAENLRFACASLSPALERVGLTAVADHRAGGLSQGMRQRLALARAILRDPELLLLDDPHAGLDASGRETLDTMVAEARERGRTVVLTAHDPAAGAIATRALRMEEGRILP
jgi:ABC-type multidrug transport system ATPase subunit